MKHAGRSIIPGLAVILHIAGLTMTLAGDADTKGSSVSGTVTYKGPTPKPAVIVMTQDPKCIALHGDKQLVNEDEVVNDAGQVKNVFVYVKDPPKGDYPVPEEAAKLSQVGCMYTPRVVGFRVGQKLNVENTDELIHNVRCMPKLNPPFNFGQPIPGIRDKVFRKPEKAMKVKCDIHAWMNAYLFAMDHPFFAVTDGSGRFEIKNLPAGEYTLVAWHEKYGEQERKIAVGADGNAAGSFEFTVEAKVEK